MNTIHQKECSKLTSVPIQTAGLLCPSTSGTCTESQVAALLSNHFFVLPYCITVPTLVVSKPRFDRIVHRTIKAYTDVTCDCKNTNNNHQNFDKCLLLLLFSPCCHSLLSLKLLPFHIEHNHSNNGHHYHLNDEDATNRDDRYGNDM
jgi:hypothetical protein